jgi:hypothetical protein
MIVTYNQLYCDTEGCSSFFPPEGPVDGAIYSMQELRWMAAQHDWKRKCNPIRDMCPNCAGKMAVQTKKRGPR